ncbi:hypothetical protein FA95DRAFT_706910 [Auriscalpium vulgare]|uniref:Uncharacterized protein n=1 Tax=Auriscalpium vulgare TaxID=40419 RepID=A0ACB8S2H4_9AGAM|nr:hypothetical protein FA95DRAFT_706910 [Auriscalpium vulgare]
MYECDWRLEVRIHESTHICARSLTAREDTSCRYLTRSAASCRRCPWITEIPRLHLPRMGRRSGQKTRLPKPSTRTTTMCRGRSCWRLLNKAFQLHRYHILLLEKRRCARQLLGRVGCRGTYVSTPGAPVGTVHIRCVRREGKKPSARRWPWKVPDSITGGESCQGKVTSCATDNCLSKKVRRVGGAERSPFLAITTSLIGFKLHIQYSMADRAILSTQRILIIANMWQCFHLIQKHATDYG